MESKFIIDTNENREYMKELCQKLLNFGKGFLCQGKGSYYLGDDGKPWTDRPIETWITCRMIHVYSIGYMLGFPKAKDLVEGAIEGLRTTLSDKVNEGWYAGVDANGNPLPLKQCYAHAFVILASTSGTLIGAKGAKELLVEALEVYDKYFWDEEAGLAKDTYDIKFKELDSYRGINANMHTVEAFLAVYDACGEKKYLNRAGRIIEHVINWAEANNFRIPEHFTENWEVDLDKNIDKPDDPFKPYGATPGHGIEWARLITQWALASYGNSSEADKYIKAAEALYNRAVIDGWNVDGSRGIVYTTDWEGKPVVHDRMHWTLAEAINTSAVLYRVTGNSKYSADYSEYLCYLDDIVLDKKTGSWFHQLDEKNNLKATVWPGKSDVYHAIQATLISYMPINKSIAKAVKESAK